MVFGWLIIGILMVFLFIAIFKTQDLMFIFSLMKKYGFIFVAIALILFVSFSFYNIYKRYDLDLTNYKGITHAGKVYYTWFISIFKNVGKITGYAVNQDWVLNSTLTNTSKSK